MLAQNPIPSDGMGLTDEQVSGTDSLLQKLDGQRYQAAVRIGKEHVQTAFQKLAGGFGCFRTAVGKIR
jgi:hypothetical protein